VAVAHDERIQVDALHVGALDAERAEADEDARPRVALDRRLAAKRVQQ